MKVIKNTAPPRGNGVTILMHGQVFFTQMPVQADQKFVEQSIYWFKEFQKENPRG